MNTIVHPPRRGEFDLLRYISIDPDEFFAAEKRRKQILEMEDRIRPGRTTPVAIRLGLFTIERLKTLAALHNTGYQTLLKEFVVERIYEEERRAGIICEPPPPSKPKPMSERTAEPMSEPDPFSRPAPPESRY
ncbi:MAG: hypothetical protein QOK19_1228 [Solirubrobacteraceae bacterium]|nr:hypothetical protein [Solirubrobacteraceae bacterium]